MNMSDDPTHFKSKQFNDPEIVSEPKESPDEKKTKKQDDAPKNEGRPFFIPALNKTVYGKDLADATAKAKTELKKEEGK